MTQREGRLRARRDEVETIKVALRYGRTGIFGAIILGFGRAFGDDGRYDGDREQPPDLDVALRAPVLHGRGDRRTSSPEATGDVYLQAPARSVSSALSITLASSTSRRGS